MWYLVYNVVGVSLCFSVSVLLIPSSVCQVLSHVLRWWNDISRCVTTVVELRICFFMLLYVMVFFFLNSSFLNVPQKKASIVRKPNNMLKTKKMPDFASSAKFRQKVKNMLCLLNYNKNFVSTIDKAWIMKAIIIVIVLMIVIWGHWLFYYHSNSIQLRALRDWAERGRSLLMRE